jgi:single-strand DNA-binding protein
MADPSFHLTLKGTSVSTFTIISSRYFKRENEPELVKEISFFEIEAWSNLAYTVKSIGRKGRFVQINGRLKQLRWTDASGNAHSRILIVADSVEFMPGFNHQTLPPSAKEAITGT